MERDQDMDELSELLRVASQGVALDYFQLNIDGGDPVYRERVYCYELYHQMRKVWPANCPFFINGEIDKRAHPILRDLGADHAKPDFLIHTPGFMHGNHAIIEAKHSLVADGVRKDLETLDLFVRVVGYQRAIYLIYGREANDNAIQRINTFADEYAELVPVEIWLHQEAGTPAEHWDTIQRGPE